MKKEIIACALLLTLAAGCVCNIRYLNRLCTQLDDAAAQAEACCAAHDTDSAAEALRTAAERWHAAESYAHCMLPHESTDAVTEGFCQAMRALESIRQSGRVVGIISHVSELQSRIPTRAAPRPPRRTLPCCVCASGASPTGSASRSAMCFSRGR